MSRTKIELAYPYTDAKGKEHVPDDVIEVDDVEAANLIDAGRARAHTPTAEKQPK